MTPAEVGKELVFPIVQPAMLLPMLITTLLLSIVLFFGILFGGMVLLATLFPFAGYLMRLLEARSAGLRRRLMPNCCSFSAHRFPLCRLCCSHSYTGLALLPFATSARSSAGWLSCYCLPVFQRRSPFLP